MQFEELKMIWDSQNDQPLYAIDETSLYASLLRKNRKFHRTILWRDIRELGIGIVAASYLSFEGVLLLTGNAGRVLEVKDEGSWANHAGFFFVAAALILVGPLLLWIDRKRQAGRERRFDRSLRGDLGKAISQVDYQIRLLRTSFWWYLIPMSFGCALYVTVVAFLQDQAVLFAPAAVGMTAALYFSHRSNQRSIRKSLLPKKRDLDSLREKLTKE